MWGAIDWWSVAIYLLLVIIGWVSIYSAGYTEENSSMFDLSQQYGKQFLWIGFALVLAIFTMRIDQRFFEAFAFVIYALSLFLLLSVLAIGVEVNGAKSWIDFGFMRLQPAELAKVGTSLALAAWISRHNFSLSRSQDFLVMWGVLLLPMGLILLQNDMGSVLTYTSFIVLFYRRGLHVFYLWGTAFAVILFAGVLSYSPTHAFAGLTALSFLTLLVLKKWQELLIFFVSAVLLSLFWWGGERFAYWQVHADVLFYVLMLPNAVFWLIRSFVKKSYIHRVISFFFMGAFLSVSSIEKVFGFFEVHQQERILALLGLKSDPLGVEYHVNQSLIAIGSGGFDGKGFLQGTQTKLDFVPEQTTDFIFSTIGEEFGFVGASIVIGLYVFLLLRLLYLAERQRSSFSKNYAYAVIGIIFFHVLINIGMVTGLGPVIGVPLPYVSYGGSSLWSFTLLLFIFLKMDAGRMEVLRN